MLGCLSGGTARVHSRPACALRSGVEREAAVARDRSVRRRDRRAPAQSVRSPSAHVWAFVVRTAGAHPHAVDHESDRFGSAASRRTASRRAGICADSIARVVLERPGVRTLGQGFASRVRRAASEWNTTIPDRVQRATRSLTSLRGVSVEAGTSRRARMRSPRAAPDPSHATRSCAETDLCRFDRMHGRGLRKARTRRVATAARSLTDSRGVGVGACEPKRDDVLTARDTRLEPRHGILS